ncbi:MAG TPA: 16S rRNA (guanine(527)-N(7))-methyltransferase RsmG [Pseudolabrys sp.]|nr:16S rRNA (guanine(527)-N(7))-methyltransferase RsmG [Pseudolabrys sp.]
MSRDRVEALKLIPVPRETNERLDRFVELLLAWQARINLIAPSTIPVLWTRHIADSLQLLDVLPGAKVWVDFGSGGGFPAVPLACALAGRPGAQVHMIESNGKKAAFLRETVRTLQLPAQVHQSRIEDSGESWPGSVEAVTARALAPLKTLCDQAFPLISRGATGVFLKGQDVDAELTEAAKYWTLQASTVPSKTSPDGCIVVIRSLKPRIRA